MIFSTQINAIDVTELAQQIQQANSLILTTHKQCDGDGLGAMLGLYHALKKINKQVRVLSVDAVPKKYNFLSPDMHLEIFADSHSRIQDTDLALIFDTNDERMVEPLFNELKNNTKKILFVDHHPILGSGPQPTAGSFINTDAASTGEIAFFIVKALNIPLDANIARCLYTSIAFDTQIFRFVKNSGVSHLISAELLLHVDNADEIHRFLFSTHTPGKIAFLAKVLGEIEYYGEGKIAILKLTKEDLEKNDLDMDDSRDVIDMIMNIHSVEVAALFRQDETHGYKLSLRSKSALQILDVAEQFQGGGHLKAAGAFITGPYESIKAKVIQSLLQKVLPASQSTKS